MHSNFISSKTQLHLATVFFAVLLLMSNVSAGYSLTLDSFVISPGGGSPENTDGLSLCVSSIGDALAGLTSNSLSMTIGFAASALDACTPLVAGVDFGHNCHLSRIQCFQVPEFPC